MQKPTFPSLDPRKLLYFATVVEHGSFKKAAKYLELSQPALSTSLDRLESAIGVKLLDRSPSGISPTAAGIMLFHHAKNIQDELNRALIRLHDKRDVSGSLIRIGTLPTLSCHVVPTAITSWREIYPHRGLSIIEDIQIELLTGLMRHDFDFVIGTTEFFGLVDGIRQRVLFRDKLCVIARHGHPLAEAQDLAWADLARCSWIVPTIGRHTTVLENAMQAAGEAFPDHVTVCGSVSLVKSLLCSGDQLSLLPSHAVQVELAEERLCSLSLEDPELNRNIAVFFREGFEFDAGSRSLVSIIEALGKSYRDGLDQTPARMSAPETIGT